jgi:hypothetical protein
MDKDLMKQWGREMLDESRHYPYTPEMIDTIILMVDGEAEDQDAFAVVHQAFLIIQEHTTEEGETT